MEDKKLWTYEGAVRIFDDIVIAKWKSQTFAASEKKARANFAFQCKRHLGRSKDTRILLPGKIVEVDLSGSPYRLNPR